MQGKARTKLLAHSAGLAEGLASGPSWDFLYQHSVIKHPDYFPGDRVVLPDGRVFRHCLEHTSSHVSAALVKTGRGVKFLGEINSGVDGVAAVVDVAQAVGDDTLSWATQTFEKDVLRGGYVSINHDNNHMQAGILGNDACAGTSLKIKLDRKLTDVVHVGDFGTLQPNPYRFIGWDGSDYNSCAGIPMSEPAAAEYFWIQTWGPCWINPGPYNLGVAASQRLVVFNPDGSLRIAADSNPHWQIAGFILDMVNLGLKARFFMLQVSP